MGHTTPQRARAVGLTVFAAVGILLIASSLAWHLAQPPALASVATVGVLTVVALELGRIPVGATVHRSVVLSVPIAALPVLVAVETRWSAVGLLALGVFVSWCMRVRRLRVAAYAAGLTGVAAVVSLGVAGAAEGIGVPSVVAWPLGAIGYLFIVLVVELVRMRYVHTQSGVDDLSALSATRFALVAGWAVALTSIGALLTELGPQDGDRRLSVIALLLGLAFLAVSMTFALRNISMRQRLVGTIAGGSAIGAAGRSMIDGHALPASGDEGADLGALLADAAMLAIGGEAVSVREYPAGPYEISARVVLDENTVRHIVLRRDPMDVAFALDDTIALASLAQTANLVAEARANIGGLTLRANTDPLTGLPNYGAFQAALENINAHREYSEALAVLFIDLDDFKRLNDRYGHHIGDGVLTELGRRFKEVVAEHDMVARVGGDEFVIILTHLSSLAEAKSSAERILAEASRQLTVGPATFHPVLSVGLAYSAHLETNISQLVQDADSSMLALKKSRRRGGPAKESSINISGHRSSQMNDIVARAIDEDRLELAFQPIVSLVTGQIWAFEALLRYTDPHIGRLSPSSLVEKAKGLGRLDLLTRQVATKAVAAAVEFQLAEQGIVCIAINIEAAQVMPERLGTFIAELAEQHPGISLCLELNERSVSGVSTAVRAETERLRDLGIMIALDDYGSRDSSVDSLVRVPMDILKIDRSLVDDLEDIRQREVLMALQGFGDSLEYSMIVEGVESDVMAAHLTRIGVRNAQGFHYGVPQSFEATLARIEEFGTRAVLPSVPPVPAAAPDPVAPVSG